MWIAGLLVVLAGSVAAAAGTSDAGSGNRPAAAPCVKLEVRDAVGKTPRPDRFFSAASVKDLAFVVSFAPRLAGTAVDLVVYTPNGHLYQRLRVAPEGTGPGRRQAAARLPVSGTLIVNSSLYGEWSVEPHMAGSPASCARPERFTITP